MKMVERIQGPGAGLNVDQDACALVFFDCRIVLGSNPDFDNFAWVGLMVSDGG